MKSRAFRWPVWLTVVCLMIGACGDDAGSPGAATSTTAEMMDETATTEMMDEEMMDDDIIAVAEAEGDLGTFLGALEAAGMMEDFHRDGPFTMFIPTDDAFAAYLDETGMSQEQAFAGTEMLRSILGYHVVTMTEDSEMVMGMDGQTLTTLDGAPLEVTVDGETVMVGNATILRYDILASNGVVHVIDAVLVPVTGS